MTKLQTAFACVLAVGCGGSNDVVARDLPETPPSAAPVAVSKGVPTAESLTAVWSSAPDDVWAVGRAGTTLHFDGTAWSAVATPSDSDLLGVFGTGMDDVWAVGDDVILHWDGTTWNEALAGMSELLFGVCANAPDDVWMTGNATDVDAGLLRHWNGVKWDVAVVYGASTLWRIWCTPSAIWTAGSASGGDGFVLRGDGSSFVQLDYPGGTVRGLWGSDPSDVWVAPYDQPPLHWDGSSWTTAPGGDGTTVLGMSGSGSEDVWAVGLDGAIVHWDGRTWATAAAITDQSLLSVWARNDDDVWAVGAKGTILHFDGTAWSAQ